MKFNWIWLLIALSIVLILPSESYAVNRKLSVEGAQGFDSVRFTIENTTGSPIDSFKAPSRGNGIFDTVYNITTVDGIKWYATFFQGATTVLYRISQDFISIADYNMMVFNGAISGSYQIFYPRDGNQIKDSAVIYGPTGTRLGKLTYKHSNVVNVLDSLRFDTF